MEEAGRGNVDQNANAREETVTMQNCARLVFNYAADDL